MRLRPVISVTKDGTDCIVFYEGPEDDKLVLKAYPSPDGSKIRIVLPELLNMAQTRIDTNHHLLEFTRDAVKAQAELKKGQF